MGKVVKLNEDFVKRVTREAKANRRSVPKQIEFYYTLAAASLDNPDTPVEWVHDLLISKEQGPGKPIKWIDEALLRLATEQGAKKAPRKSKKVGVRSAPRSRKKSLSR
jgi:hypothetical protein